jgi:hypothetical protein
MISSFADSLINIPYEIDDYEATDGLDRRTVGNGGP